MATDRTNFSIPVHTGTAVYLKLSNKSKKNTCTYGLHVTLRLLVQLYFKTLTGGHLDKSKQWITLTKPTIHVPFLSHSCLHLMLVCA